ncbi:hypothetical protein APHAL10511_002522 [Amanita phalloides]|nr:hypothetical protein APHAL10511_002522 [Amanita phalloides]
MPPHMPLLPLLSEQMSTRPGNKDKCPGLVDLSESHHTHKEAEKECQSTVENQKADEECLANATKAAAHIEDDLQHEDQRCEAVHIDEAIAFKASTPKKSVRKHKHHVKHDELESDKEHFDSEEKEPRQRSKKKTNHHQDIEKLRVMHPENGMPVSKRKFDKVNDNLTEINKNTKKKDSAPSGLLPEYRKPTILHKHGIEQESEDDNDSPAQFGSFIPEGESDNIERKGAMKKGVKKLKDQNIRPSILLACALHCN